MAIQENILYSELPNLPIQENLLYSELPNLPIQENLLYSELPNLPSTQEKELSNLERDFFGQISVPQLMSNYSKLNDNIPSQDSVCFQPPVVTLCLEESFTTTSNLKRPLNSDLGTYSTLERTSLGFHYEVRDPLHQDQEEKYTELNQLSRIQQIQGHYESLVSSEERNNACRILKVSQHHPPSQHSHPEVIYRALHRFIPRHRDEIELLAEDELLLIKLHPDLWVECKNRRTGESGVVPNHYVAHFDGDRDSKPAFLKETFCANFIGSVSTRKGSGREVAKEAMARILSERRRMRVTTVQPVLVEVTSSGVTTHVIEKVHSLSTTIPPIHFSIKQVTYSAVQGSKSVAYIVRDDLQQEKFTCYVYETEEQVDIVLEIFQKAFDAYKKSKVALVKAKS